MGLNFQEASVGLVLTPSWNPAAVSQSVARAARSGQQKVVQVLHMSSGKSIERYVKYLMKNKRMK